MQRSEMELVFVSFTVVLLALVLVLWNHKSSVLLPPTPWGLPLIGHLHLLVGKPLHRALQSVSERYGPVVLLKMGMVPTVVVSSQEIVKEIFTSHDTSFGSRPYMVSGEHFCYGYAGLVTSPYGQVWRETRKLCTVELFTARRIDSFAWMRKEELSHAFRVILDSHNSGRPVEMRELTSVFSFNNMSRMLLSKRYFGHGILEKDAVEFKKILNEITKLVIKPSISSMVPWYLRWIDWQIPTYKSIHAKQDKFLQNILDEHKNSSRECKDFLDIMIEFFGTDPQGEKRIKANLLEMLLAGMETSASTSEWFIASVMNNPRILRKLQEELDLIVGKARMVDESDLPKLEYLQLVLKETFRCYSPVVILLPRIATEPAKVAGYHIPKGTTLLVNAWAVHMDPAVWRNPTEFRPERFQEVSIDFKGQNFDFIPFGSGRRKCPGMPLGLRTVELLVANLIHGFDWSYVPGTTPSMEEVFNSACYLKTPLQAMATPRLPLEVYE